MVGGWKGVGVPFFSSDFGRSQPGGTLLSSKLMSVSKNPVGHEVNTTVDNNHVNTCMYLFEFVHASTQSL